MRRQGPATPRRRQSRNARVDGGCSAEHWRESLPGIDAEDLGRRRAVEHSLRERTGAASDIEPAFSVRNAEPLDEFARREAAPAPDIGLVAIAADPNVALRVCRHRRLHREATTLTPNRVCPQLRNAKRTSAESEMNRSRGVRERTEKGSPPRHQGTKTPRRRKDCAPRRAQKGASSHFAPPLRRIP